MKRMKWRKIRPGLLLWKTVCYRFFMMLFETLYLWALFGKLKLAFGISIGWNILNTIGYYIYHYIFARLFVIGAEQKGCTLWLTGKPFAGKSTLSDALKEKLEQKNIRVIQLDGEVLRNSPISDDLGFSKQDRDKNIARAIFLAKLLTKGGAFVITSFISPYREERDDARKEIERFMEVHVDCSTKECMNRDTKGLYKKAMNNEIKDFTGVNAPYEEPENPELIIKTDSSTIEESTTVIMDYLKKYKFF